MVVVVVWKSNWGIMAAFWKYVLILLSFNKTLITNDIFQLYEIFANARTVIGLSALYLPQVFHADSSFLQMPVYSALPQKFLKYSWAFIILICMTHCIMTTQLLSDTFTTIISYLSVTYFSKQKRDHKFIWHVTLKEMQCIAFWPPPFTHNRLKPIGNLQA